MIPRVQTFACVVVLTMKALHSSLFVLVVTVVRTIYWNASLRSAHSFLVGHRCHAVQCWEATLSAQRFYPSAGTMSSLAASSSSSSFYGSFDEDDLEGNQNEEGQADEDDEDDDEDEEEYKDLDDVDVANFRSRMKTMFGRQDPETESAVDELISFATTGSAKKKEAPEDWAKPVQQIEPGTVLVANPAKFCSDWDGASSPSQPGRRLLAKYGLTQPPPVELGPDRRADLLPVLFVVDIDKTKGCRAVLLNRRTGHLLGDLERPPGPDDDPDEPTPLLEKFCVQPLWFGGVDNASMGIDMLHQCPAVEGARKLTDDGLYWGGDPVQAQDAMSDPSLERVFTGFDFKFFVQSTMFAPGQVETLIKEKPSSLPMYQRKSYFAVGIGLVRGELSPFGQKLWSCWEGTTSC